MIAVVPAGPVAPVRSSGPVAARHRRVEPRAVAVSVVAAALVVLVGSWSLGVGDISVPPGRVAVALFGHGDATAVYVVRELRLPRVLTGIAVGAALGMSGAIFQSLTRNALGSPDVMGFNTGAALGAVVAIVTLDASSMEIAAGALGGGAVTAAIVLALAWRRGLRTSRIVLVGIGVAATLGAISDHLLTTAKITDVQRAVVWLTGSLNNRTWAQVRTVVAALAVLVPVALVLGRRLRMLELGDDAAGALGIPVRETKVALVAIGVALAATATAAAGPIGFVALVAPAVARQLVRRGGPSLLPCALLGALLTLIADVFARRAMAWWFDRPVELPVGIVTAMVGAPYLLWLLRRQLRGGTW